MISILICTYKRPILLQKCIESVINQIAKIEYEIIVVDNDKAQSAKEVADRFITHVQYFSQPVKGLSNARNMSVSKANGEFILFIDDDEYAEENWLSKIIDCQQKYNADVVLGKVIYEIPKDFPSYIRKSSYFIRDTITTGQLATINQGYSGNTLVRKKLFKLRTPPFQTHFNHTGGEDSDFFNFLIQQSAKIVFCDEAIIYEIQDEKRLEISWFLNRGYLGGYNYTQFLFKNNSFLIAFFVIIKSFFGGIVISLSLLLLALITPNKYFIKFISKFGNQLGKLGYIFKLKLKNY
ncbi:MULTISPECIES: glycosyltransferase family 2 protein [unclassified Flavobacterium]|uniref:glycosyltransferase family 2 protein n=1 Tax=unclassified Flavobacterium TaxID=196869 RepID=UPI0021034C90|nr:MULTISPECIES: glycosyltransferase family 2 protein [unclassified Flavobacterium]